MKYRTEVVREGEWLGPVDWAYDFTSHDWTGRSGGTNPKCSAAGLETLRKLAAEPEGWVYSTGFNAFPVVHVGMYDGWPFWAPTPAVGYIGPLGGVEVVFFYSLQDSEFHRAKREPT